LSKIDRFSPLALHFFVVFCTLRFAQGKWSFIAFLRFDGHDFIGAVNFVRATFCVRC
jgi:hypothetical protein